MPITGLASKTRVVVRDQEEESWGPQGHRDEHTPKGAQGLELVNLELSSLHKVTISERAISWSISTSPLVGPELRCVSWACNRTTESSLIKLRHTWRLTAASEQRQVARDSSAVDVKVALKHVGLKCLWYKQGAITKRTGKTNRIRTLFLNSRNIATWMRN